MYKLTIYEFLLILLYRGVVDAIYAFHTVKNYAYAGFVLDVDMLRATYSYLLLVVCFYFLKTNTNQTFNPILYVIFLILIIPLQTYYAYSGQNTQYFTAMMVFYILSIGFSNFKIEFNALVLEHGKSLCLALLILSVIYMLLSFAVRHGSLLSFNLDLLKVYEFRESSSTVYYAGVNAYLYNWIPKIVMPFLMGYSVYSRQYLFTLLLVAMQIVFFGLTSHKIILFIPALILFFYWISSTRFNSIYIAMSALAGISLIFAMASFSDDLLLSSLVFRRTLFVPAFLDFTYYEFFSNNQLVLLSNSIFSKIIAYPYTMQVGHVIGSFLGQENMWANTGILATSFMHFGYPGILIFSLMTGLLMSFIDELAKKVQTWIAQTILAVPTINLFVGSDFFTTLLTHGLLLSILILWLMSSTDKQLDAQPC